MKQLKVSLVYSSSDHDYSTTFNPRRSPLALPLRVLDEEGGLIAEGVASSEQAADFKIPPEFEIVFVRLTWPSGKSQTQRVSFNGRDSAEIVFTDSTIARNEWSAWAVPRLNPYTSLARSDAPPDVSIDRYDRVWLRLWQFLNGSWVHARMVPTAEYSNDAAKQLDFQLEACPWLLQVGGSTVPWRLVSLPGGGPCRVLITPKDSTDPRADSLKVVVTGFRSDAETLLEFLSRDALRAATSLAEFQPLAVRLLEEKREDPIAAIAGAYFLLRTQGWKGVPSRWFESLRSRFVWIPDAAIIQCAVIIRSGFRQESDEHTARTLLHECLQRGLPVYAEGLLLLQEAASVLLSADRSERLNGVFNKVERLAAANAWAGSAFSFYGRTPEEPSPEKFVGMPQKSRPLRSGAASRRRVGRSASRAPSERDPLPVLDKVLTTVPLPVGAAVGVVLSEERAEPSLPTRSTLSGKNKRPVDDNGVFYLGDVGK